MTFAKEGADVAVAHLPQEQADAEQTKALAEAEGRRCVLLPADLRTHEANVQVARDAVEQLGVSTSSCATPRTR